MTSTRPRIASTLLLSVALASACGPGSGETGLTEGPADTDTSAAPTDTGTTGAPGVTGTTEGPGDDTGTTALTGEPDTDTGEQACPARDPVITTHYFEIDLGDWPVQGDPDDVVGGAWIDLSADCVLVSVGQQVGALELELTCSQGDITGVGIGFFFDHPEGFASDVTDFDALKLDAYWSSESPEKGSGQWFALRDAATGALVLAGSDDPKQWKPGSIAPLSAEVAEDPACIFASNVRDETCTPDDITRGTVTFSHEAGPSIVMHDGSRALLSADGRDYDIVLNWHLLSDCVSNYSSTEWFLGGAAQG